MRWGSRKLIIAMGWQVIFTIMMWFERLPATTYEALTMVCLGGYLAANTVAKFSGKPVDEQ